MKTNLLRAINELKKQITNGWTAHEREHFDDFLKIEIKPFYPNLYGLLNGDFEAELRERKKNNEVEVILPNGEKKIRSYITIEELLKE